MGWLDYLNDQMSRWQEIVFGLLLVFIGLWAEDKIDRFRSRKRNNGNGGSH